MEPIYVLKLTDHTATLETVGGKGASLARLANAGLPVPDGFYVTTTAYRQFVRENHLDHAIQTVLKSADLTQPAALEVVSKAIQGLFAQAEIPGDISGAVARAYAALHGASPAVAVRSSATAEDLPELSFAGQQETYLNVSGIEALLESVRRCWASLWTARAIGYRSKNKVDHETVSLAVVVQLLVPAEAAGILFTADPVTGQRDQVVISAAWGLGEAIVGGLVTPDSLQVEKTSGRVLNRQIAEKETMTVRVNGGTQEQPVPEMLQHAPVLSEEQAADLAGLGVKIEELYGMPMDIEWALADGEISILQARPITALPEPIELPEAEITSEFEWKLENPRDHFTRASIVDFLPGPLSPLFDSLGRPLYNAGLRNMMEEMIGRESKEMIHLATFNGYAYMGGNMTPRFMLSFIQTLLVATPRLLRNAEKRWKEDTLPRYKAEIQRQSTRNPGELTCEQLLDAVEDIMRETVAYFNMAQSGVMGAVGFGEGLFTGVYDKLVHRPDDPPAPTFLLGFDSQPIQAEKKLYTLAGWIQERPGLADYLMKAPLHELAEALVSAGEAIPTPDGVEPADWQDWLQQIIAYLDEYGHFIYDLDFAKVLPCNDPQPILETLRMYLKGHGQNPYQRQEEQIATRQEATEAIEKRVKGLKLKIFRKALGFAQKFAAMREDCIADIGLGYPLLRSMLQELGERFVRSGLIEKADDIYWLQRDEVAEAAAQLDRGLPTGCLFAQVGERKKIHQAQKRLTPPPQLPPKSKLFGINMERWLPVDASQQMGDTIKGLGASPGRVTGIARVLNGPQDFDQMEPGDVLVAAVTTPAWTPLFAMASAVVTDIGGPLSHGSIVAREYGIPAVLGTGVATRRILSGQSITVDGNTGTVELPAQEDQPGGTPSQVKELEWTLPEPKGQYMRLSIIDLLPDTVSPLFDSLGIPGIVNGVYKVGREMTRSEPVLPKTYFTTINHYVYMQTKFTAREWWWMIAHLLPAYPRMLRVMIPYWQDDVLPRYRQVAARWGEVSHQDLTLTGLWCGIQEIVDAAMEHLGSMMYATMGASAGSEGLFTNLYEKLIRREGDPPATTFIMGYNTTPIQAEKSLYDLAEWTRKDPNLEHYVLDMPSSELIAHLDDPFSPLCDGFTQRFRQHMVQYGHMIYNLDFAKPLPLDEPALMLETIKMYLRGQGTNPHERQSNAEEKRLQASEAISKRVKGLRGWAFRKSLNWAQTLAPVREEAIAAIGTGYPALRRMLLELGCRFTQAGVISQPDHIYWLRKEEIENTLQELQDGRVPADKRRLVTQRQAEHAAAGRLTPPPALPPRKRYMGMKMDSFIAQAESEQKGDTLKGVGASSGKVTAPARVLLGPQDFDQMKPGEVLVAAITTPAWTPLFAMASAVVTDVGGPLSHGSIVAREYGIPAVMGTGVATRFIHNGQMITVDGSVGTVLLGNGTH